MPQIDRKSGEVVIRIVFDGPPEAGKTTTIDLLASMISLQRRSPITRPGTTERRTEFFDWLDFSGGFLDGHRVRCQLVSVPGQSSLLHRRRYLLDTADVVVFVADATANRLDEVRQDFATTLTIVERAQGDVPVGVVLQVNKQDLDSALTPQALASALALSPLVPVIGTSAHVGTGVMQTLILAVRLATDRVRALLLGDELGELHEEDAQPEELYRAMLAAEPPASVVTLHVSESPPTARSSTAGYVRSLVGAPRRPNPHAVIPHVLPQAVTLPAGCIWPSVTGRAALAAANQGQAGAPPVISDFAPDGAFELETDNGWLFHSCVDHWLFPTEARARLALLSIARALAEAAELLPEGRALMIAPDAQQWRLWMVTRRTPSIPEVVASALENTDAQALAQACIAVREFARAESGGSRLAASARLSSLAAQRGRMVVLTLPGGGVSSGEPPRKPDVELDELLEATSAGRPDLAQLIAAARRAVQEHDDRTRRRG